MATFLTFLISALAHELVMYCITKKLRGYGFVAMMLQMPIVLVQRSRWIRGRTLLNNVLFWCSMILGLSMVSISCRHDEQGRHAAQGWLTLFTPDLLSVRLGVKPSVAFDMNWICDSLIRGLKLHAIVNNRQ